MPWYNFDFDAKKWWWFFGSFWKQTTIINLEAYIRFILLYFEEITLIIDVLNFKWEIAFGLQCMSFEKNVIVKVLQRPWPICFFIPIFRIYLMWIPIGIMWKAQVVIYGLTFCLIVVTSVKNPDKPSEYSNCNLSQWQI